MFCAGAGEHSGAKMGTDGPLGAAGTSASSPAKCITSCMKLVPGAKRGASREWMSLCHPVMLVISLLGSLTYIIRLFVNRCL